MTARTALTAVGAIAAVIAGYSVAVLVAGAPAWVAALVVLAVAVAAAVGFTRGPTVVSAGDRRARETPGVVDCAGQSLRIGDAVRGAAGFDGPMELGFGRGVVVKVGHGKAHVRFDDIPGRVHPITPGTLRRLA
jgi:hypothetical protein